MLGGFNLENAELIGRKKQTYSGEIVEGKDVISINIGDEKMEVE